MFKQQFKFLLEHCVSYFIPNKYVKDFSFEKLKDYQKIIFCQSFAFDIIDKNLRYEICRCSTDEFLYTLRLNDRKLDKIVSVFNFENNIFEAYSHIIREENNSDLFACLDKLDELGIINWKSLC